MASGVLLAIYIVAAWYVPSRHVVRWHEFQLDQRFFVRGLCESYRPRLVREWERDPEVPFTAKNVVSSRCGTWAVDPDKGNDL